MIYYKQKNENVNTRAKIDKLCTDALEQEADNQPERRTFADASAAFRSACQHAELVEAAEDGDWAAIDALVEETEKRGLGLLTETPSYSINPALAGINTDYSTYFNSLDGQTACLVYGSVPSLAYTLLDNWLEELTEKDVKNFEVDLAGVRWSFSRAAGGNYGYFAMITGGGLSIAFCRSPGKTAGAEIPLCKVVFGWQLANSCNLADVMAQLFKYLSILGSTGLRYHISRLDIQYTTNQLQMTDIELARQQNRVVTRCQKPGQWGGDVRAAETYLWSAKKSGWLLRIYDKTREVIQTAAGDKYEWLASIIPDGRWVRIEWELKREFLRERDITTFEDLYAHWQPLISYIMANLVRFVDRDKGNHSERTEPAPWWLVVHNNLVAAADGAQPLPVRCRPVRSVQLDKLTQSRFIGAASTFLGRVLASEAAKNDKTIDEAFYDVLLRLKSTIIDKAQTYSFKQDTDWAGYSDFAPYGG